MFSLTQNKNIDTEIKHVVARERGSGEKQVKGIKRYKSPVIK